MSPSANDEQFFRQITPESPEMTHERENSLGPIELSILHEENPRLCHCSLVFPST
jgi:hypothetical protein